jgi:tRNA(adenine34) deaminase
VLVRGELDRHETFMRLALDQARLAVDQSEVPVGAVVAIGDAVIAAAHNEPIALSDPTAHAEVLALREAGRKTGNYRLPDATLYVTVEPCVMCCGAILNARLPRLVFGAADPKVGAVESLYRLLEDRRLRHEVVVTRGVLADECAALLKDFFQARRV